MRARSVFGQEIKELMLKACLSPQTLARKAGLPVTTIYKAMRGESISPILQVGLEEACKQEIRNVQLGRTTKR